jgi:hypothetical protein
LRKNAILAAEYESFEDFLRTGLEDISKKAKGHFRKCMLAKSRPGINDDDDDMVGDFPESDDENEYVFRLNHVY